MNTIYLIQGIIFQAGPIFLTGNKPGVGTAVFVQEAMHHGIFNGVVGGDKHTEFFSGEMTDKWGDSKITNFKIDGNRLTFVKTYKNRPGINYEFTQKGDIWYGSYSGPDCGTGKSKCILTPVNESFWSFYFDGEE